MSVYICGTIDVERIKILDRHTLQTWGESLYIDYLTNGDKCTFADLDTKVVYPITVYTAFDHESKNLIGQSPYGCPFLDIVFDKNADINLEDYCSRSKISYVLVDDLDAYDNTFFDSLPSFHDIEILDKFLWMLSNSDEQIEELNFYDDIVFFLLSMSNSNYNPPSRVWAYISTLFDRGFEDFERHEYVAKAKANGFTYHNIPKTAWIKCFDDRWDDNTQMLQVSGVGEAKFDKYGERFLLVISDYKDEVCNLSIESPSNNHVDISIVSKPVKQKKPKKNSYAAWALEYPNHVVVKKEGVFWTARGRSAEILSDVLGYNLGGNLDNPITGSPSLDPIVNGLDEHQINYIVVENGAIVDKADYD